MEKIMQARSPAEWCQVIAELLKPESLSRSQRKVSLTYKLQRSGVTQWDQLAAELLREEIFDEMLEEKLSGRGKVFYLMGPAWSDNYGFCIPSFYITAFMFLPYYPQALFQVLLLY